MGKGGSSAPAPQEIKETEQEKALAASAKGQWDRYTTVLAPFENRFLERIHTTQGQMDTITGQTASGVGSQYDATRKTAETNMFAGGVNPNSGRFRGVSGGLTNAAGATIGSGTVRAGLAADDMTFQNLQNAVRMGRGEAVDATRGMSSLARDASAEAAQTARLQNQMNLGRYTADTEMNNSIKSSVATAAGMGLSGWNNQYRPEIGERYDVNTQRRIA